MSSDLRVALRFQAHSGNSRREIQQIDRDLRKAGKEGARSLADESWKAGTAINKMGQAGATSYKVIRNSMRETAKAGSDRAAAGDPLASWGNKPLECRLSQMKPAESILLFGYGDN